MTASHETLAQWDQAHVIHPWSFQGPTCMIVRGEGSRYWDAAGREYLDALGGIQLCEVGHGRTELAEVAARQMAELEYAPMFWNFGNEAAATLAHHLAELAPDAINQVYFTNGGSESCESAIKMARQYHHLRGQAGRTTILSLRHGYHGLTYGAMAATGLPGLQTGFGEPPPGFVHLSTPYPYRAEFLDGAGPVDHCLHELEETIERLGADTIAAMIAEPALTVGGAILPPDGYWEAASDICQRHGILMIADEVVTAFGRLGHWFASEARGQNADLIDTATEEILRWVSPVIQFARTATDDVVLGGTRIRAGDTVGIFYPSANRDESAFDDPYRFDITRSPNYHQAFGHGAHFCLGANLARWELRAALRALVPVLPRLQLVGEPQRIGHLHLGIVKHQNVALR